MFLFLLFQFLSFSYVINEDVNNTGISFFAIFDGHGGEFAAIFAKDILVENLFNKITDTSHILTGKVPPPSPSLACSKRPNESDNNNAIDNDEATDRLTKDLTDDKSASKATAQRRSSFKKSLSTADDCNGTKTNCNRDQDIFLNKLNAIVRTKDSFLKTTNINVKPQQYGARCYIDKDRNINFGKMITDEVLAADYKLVEKAKKEVSKRSNIYLIASTPYRTIFVIFCFSDKCSRNNCIDCRHA